MPTWRTLNSESQLDEINDLSFEKPVAVFKHSTRCFTSSLVKSHLEDDWNLTDTDFPFYFLDLIAFRNISNQIARRFQVTHQSPQLIILKSGKAVYHESHNSISYDFAIAAAKVA